MKPQLRFSGFTDEWQVKKLGDIAEKGQYGINAASKSYDGTNKYLRITDIDENSHKFNRDSLTSPSGKLKDRYLLECGDLLFARTGASTGKTYLYNDADGKVFFAGFLIRFHINEAKPYFVYSQTLRRDYQKWVAIMSARSGQPGINADEYAKLSVSLPSKPEQEKIADFLTAVDERIAASERKYELLTRYKRGIMQQLFSQKIRFKKPDGSNYPDWKEKKLGSLAVIKTGKKDANIAKEDGQYRFYTCSRNYLHTDIYSFEGEAILVAGNADVGLCHYYNGKFEAYQRTYVLQDFKTDGKFLFRYLSHFFRAYALGLMQTSAMTYITLGTLQNFTVPVPSSEEQQKIADFLTTLDSRITAERTKLTAAKQFKKALLQRMFV